MNKALSPAAFLLAAAALWLTFTANPKPGPDQASGSSVTAQPELQAEVARLKDELKRINESHAALETKLKELAARPSQAAPSDNSELQRRIAALEAQQGDLTKFTNEFDRYGVVSSLEAELVGAYSNLMDTNQTVGARLKQVEDLKRYRHFDERALQAVADIYMQTDNFNQKGQALAAMRGLVTPEFRDQVLTDLNAEVAAGSKSGRFRYYAIEALEPMLPDPAVREWLVHLSQNDPEPELAGRAGQALRLENGTSKP